MEQFTKVNQKGQSLLELTIALGIATMIISALTVTTLVSLRNSQFAQNQLQATKFAQDGLELIKTARSKNCPISANGNTYYWYNDPSLIWSYQVSNPNIQYMSVDLSSSPCIVFSNSLNPQILGNLSRSITVTDSLPGVADSKVITSTVTWSDISGSHESKITTILTDH